MPDNDQTPPPVLDYGHHEPAWRATVRVQRAEANQGWLNVLRYWMWYYGGPTYLGIALAVGAAVTLAIALASRGAVVEAAAYLGGLVVWVFVALRPRHRDF